MCVCCNSLLEQLLFDGARINFTSLHGCCESLATERNVATRIGRACWCRSSRTAAALSFFPLMLSFHPYTIIRSYQHYQVELLLLLPMPTVHGSID